MQKLIIKKQLNCKFIFVYHNNPQDLRFSKSVKERLFIAKNCDQLYFVSNWVMDKFFEGLPFEYKNNCEILYPGINKINKFPKNIWSSLPNQSLVIFLNFCR